MPEKKKFKKRQVRKKPAWQLEIANERIEILFNLAEQEFKNNRPDLSDRYVEIARKIGMKYNVPLTMYRRMFCRGCGRYLVLGINAKAKLGLGKKTMQITCLDCGHVFRIGCRKKD